MKALHPRPGDCGGDSSKSKRKRSVDVVADDVDCDEFIKQMLSRAKAKAKAKAAGRDSRRKRKRSDVAECHKHDQGIKQKQQEEEEHLMKTMSEQLQQLIAAEAEAEAELLFLASIYCPDMNFDDDDEDGHISLERYSIMHQGNKHDTDKKESPPWSFPDRLKVFGFPSRDG